MFIGKLTKPGPFKTSFMQAVAYVIVGVNKLRTYSTLVFEGWNQLKAVEDNFKCIRCREGFDKKSKADIAEAYCSFATEMGVMESQQGAGNYSSSKKKTGWKSQD